VYGRSRRSLTAARDAAFESSRIELQASLVRGHGSTEPPAEPRPLPWSRSERVAENVRSIFQCLSQDGERSCQRVDDRSACDADLGETTAATLSVIGLSAGMRARRGEGLAQAHQGNAAIRHSSVLTKPPPASTPAAVYQVSKDSPSSVQRPNNGTTAPWVSAAPRR
jgi:hypothetical protein